MYFKRAAVESVPAVRLTIGDSACVDDRSRELFHVWLADRLRPTSQRRHACVHPHDGENIPRQQAQATTG